MNLSLLTECVHFSCTVYLKYPGVPFLYTYTFTDARSGLIISYLSSINSLLNPLLHPDILHHRTFLSTSELNLSKLSISTNQPLLTKMRLTLISAFVASLATVESAVRPSQPHHEEYLVLTV